MSGERSISENITEIEANLESIERTFWRYGIPALVLAWFTTGMLVGLAIGVYLL